MHQPSLRAPRALASLVAVAGLAAMLLLGACSEEAADDTGPVGVTSAGLPIGFQIAAPAFQDLRMLAIAEFLEGQVGFDPTPPVLKGAAVGA